MFKVPLAVSTPRTEGGKRHSLRSRSFSPHRPCIPRGQGCRCLLQPRALAAAHAKAARAQAQALGAAQQALKPKTSAKAAAQASTHAAVLEALDEQACHALSLIGSERTLGLELPVRACVWPGTARAIASVRARPRAS